MNLFFLQATKQGLTMTGDGTSTGTYGLTTGSGNVMVGYNSGGGCVTGSNNTFLGTNTQLSGATEGITTQCKSIFLNLTANDTLEWFLGVSGGFTMTIGGANHNSGNTTFNAIRIVPGYTTT